MNAPHLRLTGHLRSIYDASVPESHAEALYRRQVLDAGQRAFREMAEGRVRPDPAELALQGHRISRAAR
jgi:hypothetical protein